DLGGRIERADHARGTHVGFETGGRGVDNNQLMRLHVLLDVLEGELVRRRVDQARAWDHGRRLRQPGGKPETLYFALHLIARAGAAVITVEGRSLEEKRFHGHGVQAFKIGPFKIGPFKIGTARRWFRSESGCPANKPSRQNGTSRTRRSSTGRARAKASMDLHECQKYHQSGA